METLTDTLQITKFLERNDFTQSQAEAISEVAKRFDQANKHQLVTRDYLHSQLQGTEGRMIKWVVGAQVAATGLLLATNFFG